MNAAFIPNKEGLQNTEVAYFEVTLAQFVANANVIEFEGIPGSEIVRGHVQVDTAFNTTGTDTYKVGDAIDDDRYLAATNLKATSRTALVPTGYQIFASNNKVRITRVPADTAATTGKIRVFVEYAVLGKTDTTQG